jgi:hypothetical protein
MSSATETAERNEDQIDIDNGAQRAADQGYDLFRRPQDAYVEVVRTWMESFNRFVPRLFTWTVDPKGLGVDEAIDSAFDLAEELLASQRRIAHQIFGASKPLLDVAVKQQRELVEQGGRVQREFVDQIEPQREAEREQAEQEQAEREEAEREQAQRERQEAKSKYQSMTLEELREAAAKGGIEGRSLGKQQLIDALLERR